MDDLLDLNAQQRAAVQHNGSPLLILAGPGSGKTRVITERVAHLVENGVPPERIMAITFTNRAAREMESRLQTRLGDARFNVGTFHWAANGILRRHAHRIGLRRDFHLLPPSEARSLFRRSLQGSGAAAAGRAARLAAAVSAVKNGAAVGPAARRHGVTEAQLVTAMHGYDEALRSAGALDLDGLLTESVRLLRDDPDAREYWASRWDELLVDEYQDTNPVQHELVTLLGSSGRVTVVGDEDQAIYGWRQADIHNVLAFRRAFPGATVITLQETYRSTKYILRAARALVEHNRDRTPKQLRTIREAGRRPILYAAGDEAEEAEWVAETIEHEKAAGRAIEDIAVLFRVNAQSRALEEALLRHGIPYRLLGAQRFYERAEVRRAIAYLRLALDGGDRAAVIELLREIPGVGPKRLAAVGGAEGPPLDALATISLPSSVRRAVEDVMECARTMTTLRDRSLRETVAAAIRLTRNDLDTLPPLQYEAVLDNLAELEAVLTQFTTARTTLRDTLDRVSLGLAGDSDRQGVSLMTLHAAKGLEFGVVFLTGLEDGLLPHRRAGEAREAVEEERRLCYVGMTRARDMLYLSHAHTRLLSGATSVGTPSRFVAEIGYDHLDVTTSRRVAEKPRLFNVSPGQRVAHPRWGAGTVARIEGRGRDTMVTIDFDRDGRKRIQLRHAPLVRVSDDLAV